MGNKLKLENSGGDRSGGRQTTKRPVVSLLDCTGIKDLLHHGGYQTKIKMIVSGNVFELYQYQFPVVIGKSNSGKRGLSRNRDSDRHEEYRKRTSTNARNKIRRLALANFNGGDKFCTLTFSDTDEFDITNISDCNTEFKKFIQRLRRRFNSFKYITVIEFQKRGAVHYHMLTNLPYVDSEQFQKLWSNGFIKINRIDTVNNVGAYLVKYMSKNVNDKRLDGNKCYFTSKGLIKPTIHYRGDASLIYIKHIVGTLRPVYQNSYASKISGLVHYAEYNPQRTDSLIKK